MFQKQEDRCSVVYCVGSIQSHTFGLCDPKSLFNIEQVSKQPVFIIAHGQFILPRETKNYSKDQLSALCPHSTYYPSVMEDYCFTKIVSAIVIYGRMALYQLVNSL
ncbi:hypothetical protein BDEG_24455 [Batrachochytrium dendrobatidis JEL423]|uniref:Uncharacterized protein n=1 Tax=Batrachochytrium dendrobatidis (strain JEL423) TaxID=403673 RepID=A0A177WM46_BATDL|nr:hypothetical protein BDEG_24455 [Batrachochytrium dendrobatidis JEL423]